MRWLLTIVVVIMWCASVSQTVYVRSKDDPIYMAYQDSLFKWNYYQFQLKVITELKNPEDPKEGEPAYIKILTYKRDNEFKYNPSIKKSNKKVTIPTSNEQRCKKR